MKNSLIIILTLFFSCLCLSQVKEDKLDSILSATTLNLKNKKIIDIFCISNSSWEDIAGMVNVETGKTIGADSELNKFKAYVFWKENSKIFLQKFDYLGKYDIIEFEDFGLFKIIEKNYYKIKNEKVLEYEIRKGLKKVTLLVLPSSETKLHFYFKNNIFIKEFNQYDLVETEYSDGRNKNLNYKSNNKLKMIEIFNICHSKIEEAKDNKLFHKTEE